MNPVTTEALIQLTLGAPQILYNGGLLQAPVRYFDASAQRPGLPPDVSALVEKVESDRILVVLVNTSALDTRQVLIQAGTLGEHRFRQISYDRLTSDYPAQVGTYSAPATTSEDQVSAVQGIHIQVELPPATQIRLAITMDRCVNDPSYRLPW